MLSIRKISAAGLTYRHFARYRQIVTILFKYGFENILGAFKIDKYINVGLKLISRKRRELMDNHSRPQRVRMALEDLGPTFIKLGQALSMRPDFVSVEFINELSKLQDMVPPCDFPEIKAIIESEFNLEIDEIFDFFDITPIASASIGQVHKARLKDGREVAVKVQRPDLDKLIAVDLGIMYHLASLIENNIAEISFIRPVKIVEEFTRIIAKELDYNIEANHLERFARDFSDDPTIHIPEVYRILTSKRVLTMEFIYGTKASDIKSLEKAGIDKKKITCNGANLLLKQIFDHGFFHSDPHSGNIFILANNVIAMLDFGQVGAVDQQSKEDFVDLIESVVLQNPFKATRQLLRITYWDKKPDIRRLEKEVADFIGNHLHKPLKELNISLLIQDLLNIVSRYKLRIPPDIFLMMKALGTIEGIARRLDPDFDMIEQAAPFIKQIKMERVTPQRLSDDLYTLTGEFIQFFKQFPTDMMEISRLIKEQKLSLRIDKKSLETIQSANNKTGNRISFSIIIAALIIGSAIVIIAKTPPFVFGMSFLGFSGIAVSAVMGLWLFIGIVRNGRL
ncbi:MAG: AarF/ABC1/UbiB kinase family protein [Desulfobacteraceae bacterium]|nr:AarF/ABC1/UbiB kinase family protein [Desulfobacteraceae bacterium]MBC2757799.1 AarF/ABC1/UbiB kinase family protein [Desulfobacteraceae bacterium]